MNDDFDSRVALEELNGAWDADPFNEPTVRADANVILDMLADELDDRLRETLSMIREIGGVAFKRNGTLNVNRVAAMSGRPQRTLYRRIEAIKNSAQVMGL
ncbi:MAG: hypothetical protein EHM48_00760 [Planctomycetaceae bacterium]|nr:MAG: hypothetical protein EHM48_00760 [Planctomycetaceae bacterium]